MGKKEDRVNHLLDILNVKKKISAEEVTEMLGISDSSTRRLFLELEKTGRAVRILGGIQLTAASDSSYSFESVERTHLTEKIMIAHLAADLIQNGDVVYFDSGTTVLQLAITVKTRVQSGALNQLRVITNSYANMQILNDVCEVILIGGIYRPRRKDFAGYASEQFLKSFYYKKAFLGADGFDFAEGFMGTDTETARLNEIVIAHSEQCFVLLDSSKIGVRSFTRYAESSKVEKMITDSGMTAQMESRCRQAGIAVVKPAG